MEAAQPGTLLSSLQERIVSLERSSWMNGTSPASKSSPPSSSNDGDASGDAITPDLRRAKRHVQESRCHSSAWRLCPPDYYAIDLDERMRILGAHSTSQLCKACLFENRNFVTTNDCDAISMDAGGHDDDDDERGGGRGADPTNSRYYLIVVQYVESINVKKLASELRGLRPPGPRRFDPGYFADLRLAPEETSAKHTGYGHNGVSPFGMLDKSIPVIVCKSIMRVRPNFIWMGGGHKDWKLGMAVSEFIRGVNAIVLDVSEPRSGAA